MKTDIDKLNERIDHLCKIIDNLIGVDKPQSERIDTVNSRIDTLYKKITS